MTKLEKRRGQIRVIGSVLVLILVIISIKFFIQNSNRKVTSTVTPAHAQAVESTKALEVVSEPVSEPTPVVEPVEAPQEQVPVYAPVSEDEAKNFIYQHESSGRLDAMNSIGACGLGQSLPCSKLESVCPDWRTDYACQDAWFTNYMLTRYGSWDNARAFWLQHSWW